MAGFGVLLATLGILAAWALIIGAGLAGLFWAMGWDDSRLDFWILMSAILWAPPVIGYGWPRLRRFPTYEEAKAPVTSAHPF